MRMGTYKYAHAVQTWFPFLRAVLFPHPEEWMFQMSQSSRVLAACSIPLHPSAHLYHLLNHSDVSKQYVL